MHLEGKIYELQMHCCVFLYIHFLYIHLCAEIQFLLFGNSGLQLENTSCIFRSAPCYPRYPPSIKSNFDLKATIFDPVTPNSK